MRAIAVWALVAPDWKPPFIFISVTTRDFEPSTIRALGHAPTGGVVDQCSGIVVLTTAKLSVKVQLAMTVDSA